MKKNRWVLGTAVWVAALSFAQQPADENEAAAKAKIEAQRTDGLIRVQPWVNVLGPDRLGVVWMTSLPADGVVEWTQAAGSEAGAWQKAWYSQDGLRQANGTVQRAVVRLDDPSKPVRLRAISRPIVQFGSNRVVFDGAVTSRTVTVSAPARGSGKVSFLVFNDIHSRSHLYPQLAPVAGAPVDFVVLNGDVLQDPPNEEEVAAHLLQPMAWFASQSTPCFFLRGNHETRGAHARHLKDYLLLPDGRYYAAMTLGSARILFLDSGEDKEDGHREYSGLVDFDAYIEEELAWLKLEIESEAFKRASWRVVVVHIPPHWRRTEGQVPLGMRRMCDRFAPLFDEGNVDVVISGHTHQAEVLEPCPDPGRGFRWPVFIGGAHPLEKATVIRVDASPETLKVVRYQSDGSVGAEWSKQR